MKNHALLTSLFLLALPGCSSTRNLAPIPSPDSRLTIVPTINQSQSDKSKYLCVRFSIVDAKGKMVHQEQTSASSRMKWSLNWQGNDKIVLKSADIGTFMWQRGANGKWKKITP
jgi:hypothetical protein